MEKRFLPTFVLGHTCIFIIDWNLLKITKLYRRSHTLFNEPSSWCCRFQYFLINRKLCSNRSCRECDTSTPRHAILIEGQTEFVLLVWNGVAYTFNCSKVLLYQANLTQFLFHFFSLPSFYWFICFATKSNTPWIFTFPFVKYRWHAVAAWTWDAQDETCGICRMAFDGCCPDCKLPGDDCPLSKLLIIFYGDFHC